MHARAFDRRCSSQEGAAPHRKVLLPQMQHPVKHKEESYRGMWAVAIVPRHSRRKDEGSVGGSGQCCERGGWLWSVVCGISARVTARAAGGS